MTMSLPPENIPISDLISLTDKRAVVTGGATGIGFAISSRLCEAGAKVLITDKEAEDGRKASEQLKSSGYEASFTQCDVSREDEVQYLFDTTVPKFGGVDILVNNAGIYPRLPLFQMTGNDFEHVMSVNLTGTFLCSRYASMRMIEQKRGGCIINLASVTSVHPGIQGAGLSAYASSKGGVLMLTKSMALELGQYHIRVNAIAPGYIMTKTLTEAILSHTRESSQEEEKTQLDAVITRMALGRLGRTDDVGRVALFLASDLASYMTGSMVVVDGGYLIS